MRGVIHAVGLRKPFVFSMIRRDMIRRDMIPAAANIENSLPVA